MKRLFLFSLYLLVLSAAVFSAVYRSNELGQKLEEKESLDQIGFELEITENTENLYKDGTVIRQLFRYSDGYETRQEGVTERVFVDEEGKPQRRIRTSEEGQEEYNYFYDGRLLVSFNYAFEGEVLRSVCYLRTKDGILLGFEDESGFSYVSASSYVYESEGETIRVTPFQEEEEVLPERIVKEELDGGYTEVLGELARTYDGNGRLTKEEEKGRKTSYSYSTEGALLSVLVEEDSTLLETIYENGRAVKTQEYDGRGQLKTVSTVLEDGSIEEIRYVDGVPRYRFVFDRDGKRIREATGL